MLWTADDAARMNQFRRVSEDDGPSEEDPAVAMATAQSILDAADITLPTGDLYNGAYDAFGNYYQMFHHIVSDPQNLLRAPGLPQDDDLNDAKAGLTSGDEAGREFADEEAERRREEKGKAVVDIRDQITIRARLSDGSRDVNVAVDKADPVRRVARLIGEQAKVRFPHSFPSVSGMVLTDGSCVKIPSNKKIRIAYMGKILQENASLMDQGWKQGHVVNALVFNR